MARRTTNVGISGSAVLFGTVGLYLIFVGVKDVKFFDGLRDILRGQKPAIPEKQPFALDDVSRLQNPVSTNTPSGPVSKGETRLVAGTGIRVHHSIVSNVANLVKAAKAAGINIDGGGWRSNTQQRALRLRHCCLDPTSSRCSCGPSTAVPGESRHEWGLAIDFTQNGRIINKLSSLYIWLTKNASRYGLKNLPSEPWHWSTDGK